MWINVGAWPETQNGASQNAWGVQKLSFAFHCVPMVRRTLGCQGRPDNPSNRTLHKQEASLFPCVHTWLSKFKKKMQLTWSQLIKFRHHSLLMHISPSLCHVGTLSECIPSYTDTSCLLPGIASTCFSCRWKSSLLTAIHYMTIKDFKWRL